MTVIKAVHSGFVEGPRGRTWYKITGSGPGLPLVIIHGGPGATHEYLLSHEDLANHRPVLFYDQLGAGNSDIPDDVSDWNNDVLVAELERLLDALSLGPMHLLGQSWGSIVATEYALSHPDLLASLILAGPALSIPRYAAAANTLRGELPADVREILDRHETAGTTDSAEYEAASHEFYVRHVCRLDPWPQELVRSFGQMNHDIYNLMQGPSEFVINGIHQDYDVTPRLQELAVPVLYTAGRFDEMRPVDVYHYAGLTPNAEVAIFENSSHCPHYEDREEYMITVEAFLRRVESPES